MRSNMLLQDAAAAAGSPSISEWRAILLLMGAGIAAVFGALTLSYKGRTEDQKETIAALRAEKDKDDAAHERALQVERDRTARAEKTADDTMSKLTSTIAITAEQTVAIREFGSIVKEGAGESRRVQERLDVSIRTTEELRRAISEAPSRRPTTYRDSEHVGD